jgi:hypothetical protein
MDALIGSPSGVLLFDEERARMDAAGGGKMMAGQPAYYNCQS